MKKLYGNKGKVHPSPPPSAAADRLSLLPAAILALTVALSPEDKEVLSYLISCSGTTTTNFSDHRKTTVSGGDHPPLFHCNCFRCYMSYWVRWDNSPNRQLIHEILDAYEDGLFNQKKNLKGMKKERRKRVNCNLDGETEQLEKRDSAELESPELSRGSDSEVGGEDCEVGLDQKGSSVRKIVSFIGERIWGVWGI